MDTRVTDTLQNPAQATRLFPDAEALFAAEFDPAFYLSQLKDAPKDPALETHLRAAEVDPAAHFCTMGWRLGLSPNRWFDTQGYLAANPDVAAMGINPFLHYLDIGLKEERRAMPFFQDRRATIPGLTRPGRSEYGPLRHVLAFDGTTSAPPDQMPERLAVHIHLFYPEMLEQMLTLLRRLPCGFELLVSTRDGVDRGALQQRLAQALPRARQVILRQSPNRGRDMAPWLVSFAGEIRRSDLFLHLHTKTSAHHSYHLGWFEFLGHSLLGSDAVTAQMLALFARDPALGMVAPGYWPMLRRAPNYGQTRDLCDHLSARMGITPPPPICMDFPAGGFFCCRSALLAPLLDLGLRYEDFPLESGQICGTPAHAIERLLGHLPQLSGQRFDMVAVDLPFEQAAQQVTHLAPLPPAKLHRPARSAISVLCALTRPQAGIGDTLASALAQQPAPQEVILADISGDDQSLRAITARFAPEIAAGRLRLLAPGANSPGAAYNLLLEEAGGEILTYLDESTLWAPGYLAQITAVFRAHPEAQSLSAAQIKASGQISRATADRASALRNEGQLPLATFSHRRALSDQGLRFDPALGAGAPWDLLLRASARQAPLHLDQAYCATTDTPAPLPPATRQAVQLRHRQERLYWRQDLPQIAIKIAAPKPEFKHRWGDLHLAESLAAALERLGCRARVDILPDWYHHHPEDDAVLVLRGVTAYEPDPHHINMMWHISHPARVTPEEMRRFDHVFVSAYPEAADVIAHLGLQASVMLQCGDPERFNPQVDMQGVPRHDLLFVGNSRKTRRWMPEACIERGLPLAIYGAEWEGLIPPGYVQGSHIPNNRLAAYYRAARIVLNDHWSDMAARGFISNRIMDAGLAGAMVISDHFEGTAAFMGQVVTCRSPAEVEEAVRYYLSHEAERQAAAEALRQQVLLHHRVELRARQLLTTLRGMLSDRVLRAAMPRSGKS